MQNMHLITYTMTQKNNTLDLWLYSMANVDQFSKLFHWQIQKKLCCRIFHLNLTVLPHYLAKFKNLKYRLNFYPYTIKINQFYLKLSQTYLHLSEKRYKISR